MSRRSFDVIVVGGGVHGASAAYHLAASGFGGTVLLVEKDPALARAASALSAGGIRQQFSAPVNIAISLHGIAFLRQAGELLAVDDERPDVALREGGYLFLASPAGQETLRRNHALQSAMGADVAVLDGEGLRAAFPWLSMDGVVAGCLGRSGEGWFDGYGLAQALKRKAVSLGVATLAAEAAALVLDAGRVTGVRLADGSVIHAGAVVLAAGTATPDLATAAGIALPVEARKRMVFTFACRTPLPRFPMLIDPSGVYVRPEGDIYIAGTAPAADDDPPATDFEVDHGFFEETIWPVLATRVPPFEAIRPGRAWAGHYDFNTVDQNAIVGPVPGLDGLFLATGFSGHGLQQAPAVGRGLAELIAHGRYTTLDLSPLGVERIAAGRPLVEENVV